MGFLFLHVENISQFSTIVARRLFQYLCEDTGGAVTNTVMAMGGNTNERHANEQEIHSCKHGSH